MFNATSISGRFSTMNCMHFTLHNNMIRIPLLTLGKKNPKKKNPGKPKKIKCSHGLES